MAKKIKVNAQNTGPLYDAQGNEVANVPESKPIYKKWWFWVLAVLLLAIIISALGGDDKDSSASNDNAEVITTAAAQKTYNIDELDVRQDETGAWVAYAGNEVASDYTGVARNSTGTWYIENGKVNFDKTGSVTINDVLYTIEGGKVVSEAEVRNGTTKKVEKTQFNVGETLEFSDKQIKYVSANDNWTGYESYVDVPAGMSVLQLTFDVVNNSNSDFFISSGEFQCYADNESCETFLWSGDTFMETLSPGRQASGKSVYFLIPQGANSVVVEYEKNIFSSNHVEFIVR